jgi:hypothetical protein
MENICSSCKICGGRTVIRCHVSRVPDCWANLGRIPYASYTKPTAAASLDRTSWDGVKEREKKTTTIETFEHANGPWRDPVYQKCPILKRNQCLIRQAFGDESPPLSLAVCSPWPHAYLLHFFLWRRPISPARRWTVNQCTHQSINLIRDCADTHIISRVYKSLCCIVYYCRLQMIQSTEYRCPRWILGYVRQRKRRIQRKKSAVSLWCTLRLLSYASF